MIIEPINIIELIEDEFDMPALDGVFFDGKPGLEDVVVALGYFGTALE